MPAHHFNPHLRMRNRYEHRGDHCVLFLKRNKGEAPIETTIDIADFEAAAAFGTWSPLFSKHTRTYYAISRTYFRDFTGRTYHEKALLLHRLVMGDVPGAHVDHISGDTLDNRRSNLRFASRTLNAINRAGVTPHVRLRGSCWTSEIKLHGQVIELGKYGNRAEAEASFWGGYIAAKAIEAHYSIPAHASVRGL